MKKSSVKKLVSVIFAVLLLLESLCFFSCSDNDGENVVDPSFESDTVRVTETEYETEKEIDKTKETEDGKSMRIYIENKKFMVGGEQIWLVGMNAPWQHWNDFGGYYNPKYWDSVFSMIKEDGFNSCRIWITCSGEVGVNINNDGYVSGATDKHWHDLDSLFSLAEKHGIYIMATLLSFDHFKNTYTTYEKWRNWLKSKENIESYVDNYVIPFCKRYGENEYLYSIDLMNEPDWVYENEECGKISWAHLGNYFSRAAAAIHEHSDILVTVGFGIIKYNSERYEGNYGSDSFLQSRYRNENAYLDFWSTHYYDWQAAWFSSPFVTTPAQFGADLSKPIVVGECGLGGIDVEISSKKYKKSIVECYEYAYNAGYGGVFAWTDRDLISGDGIPQYRTVKKAGIAMKEIMSSQK